METPQSLLKKFNTLKTLPHVAIRLCKLISDENSSIKEFEEIIKLDPILVLRLLRVVNSSYYGLRQKVDTISRAVVLIGIKNLRNMIITESLKDIFRINGISNSFSKNQLWLHCAAVSICGQMIAERIFGQRSEDIFLCGILHDIGLIIELQVVTDIFMKMYSTYDPEKTTFTDHEKTIIGTDHCTTGYQMAKEWNLPDEVAKGIRDHHSESVSLSPSSISGIIQIAEYIVIGSGYTYIPKMKETLPSSLTTHIQENLEEYKILTQDLPDEMIKAKELYETHEG